VSLLDQPDRPSPPSATTPTTKRPPVPAGSQRCFYTLWGRDEEKVWENVPDADLVDSIVPGTGRQDWRNIRPFDLLPAIGGDVGNERRALYTGEALRISCAHIAGPQPHFERAGDYDTIFFQFTGHALVETSFGIHPMGPGEALLVPAIVAHRTIGSRQCRRMEYAVRDLVTVHLPAAKEGRKPPFRAYPAGVPDDLPPMQVTPASDRIREHLTRWGDRPNDDFWFERRYQAMVGGAEGGRRPIKISPFDDYVGETAGPADKMPAVRTALLWESATFRQRIYANPGRQPFPHRGYDEDELWFQMIGPIGVEMEHGSFEMQTGDSSMAEAGISHTTNSRPGLYRLTTYTPKPVHLVVDPAEHRRETHWVVEETRNR
jgi:mannose-6-phosphate isomerase-like protein (cupin superfamily)